jgi:hypothetical protein
MDIETTLKILKMQIKIVRWKLQDIRIQTIQRISRLGGFWVQ